MLQNPYVLAFIISLCLNLFFFVLAYTLKTDKFTDFTYGLTFIVLALFLAVANQSYSSTQIIAAAMVVIWAIRLVSYLLIRILKIGKDSRFDDKRDNLPVFLQFWIFQGVTVFVIMLPLIYLLARPEVNDINPLMVAGVLIWLTGLLIETISDKQKFEFKNDPGNKSLWIQSGLWKYSRHPNYFGEMLVWWGIFIYVTPSLYGWAWATVAGPLFITFILSFVSGIPILEKRYDQKYAGNKKYREYVNRTSILIPLPPKS